MSKDLTNAISRNFRGCSRNELDEYAKQMDVATQENWKDDTVIKKLLERLGKLPNEPDGPAIDTGPVQRPISETPADPTEDLPAFMQGKDMPSQTKATGMSRDDLMALLRLNLSPTGIWQGRRRIIQITKPEGMKGVQPHPFTWAGNQVMIPWGTKVSVPYPHYNIAVDAVFKEVVQRRVQDTKGTPIIINEYISQDRFRTSDMGDDPETLNLPISQKEQFQIIATNLGHFANTPRRMLAKIAKRLRVRYQRDTQTDDIRYLILEKLGFDLDDLFDESKDDLI